ncbi:MAG TPA: hypothetical protein VE955_00765 [Candidatus Dormibacteraeota bacterium]|nr:hypothetical protein [Candidatus Dormibacteraeota bacterium]
MSQLETPQHNKPGIKTRSIVLLLLIVGLGAGATAYAFASAYAQTPTTTNNLNGQWPGWRGPGPLVWHDHNGTFTSFRAGSTIANVSVTGFSVVDSAHVSLTLTYSGAGSAPAATIVVVAPGLSGSNTVTAGWTSPDTVSVHLVGSGSLSTSMTCVRVLVVPLTGA